MRPRPARLSLRSSPWRWLSIRLTLVPTGALAAAVSQFGVAVPIYLWLLRRNLPRRVSVDRALALDLLRFSRWPFAAAVFGFLVVRVDVLIVDAVLGAGDAGRYAVAVTLSQAVYLFPLAIGINLMPRAARGRSVEDTANVMRRLALPYAGLCLLLGLLADPIVDIGFGAEYRQSVELLRLLLPGTFALGALAIVSYHFAATGYPRQAVLAWAVGLVLTSPSTWHCSTSWASRPRPSRRALPTLDSRLPTAGCSGAAGLSDRGLDGCRSPENLHEVGTVLIPGSCEPWRLNCGRPGRQGLLDRRLKVD